MDSLRLMLTQHINAVIEVLTYAIPRPCAEGQIRVRLDVMFPLLAKPVWVEPVRFREVLGVAVERIDRQPDAITLESIGRFTRLHTLLSLQSAYCRLTKQV